MPVMKYTPQFVERQYIPTQNIGLIDQVLGQRQKEYDTAIAMQNAAMSELYGLQTTQGFEPERNKIIEELQQQITQAAQKRGGDYGAAAQDIAQILSKAQSNPFFQRNKRALEEAQYLQRLRAQNPSLRVMRDPNTVAYDPNLRDEDLQYQVFDPTQMIKIIDQMYEDRKSRRGPLEVVTHPVFGTIARQRIGMTDEEIAAESTPENVNMILSQMGYGDLAERDPQLYQEMANTMYNRLRSFNQGYSESPWSPPADRGRGTQGGLAGVNILPHSGMMLVPENINDLGTKTFSRIGDTLAVEEAKRLGIPGVNSLNDLYKLTSSTVSLSKDDEKDPSYRVGSISGVATVKKPYGTKADEAIKNIEKKLGDGLGTGLPMYEVNRLATTDPTEFRKINDIQKQLNEVVFSKRNSIFDPFSSKDRKALKNMKKDGFNVTYVVPNFKEDEAGIILILSGVDEDGKEQTARVQLKSSQLGEEQRLIGYLGQLNPIIAEEYVYSKQPGKDAKIQYLENLYREALEAEPQTRQVIGTFIQTKLKELNIQ